MGWESSDVVRVNLGPLTEGQSANNLLIIGPRGFQRETNL